MRVTVADHHDPQPLDLRPAGELAPNLALPWIIKLRYGVLVGQILLLFLTHFVFDVELPIDGSPFPWLNGRKQHYVANYRQGIRRSTSAGIHLPNGNSNPPLPHCSP